MSLDFALLGKNGSPEKTVSLGVDLHHRLVTTAASLGLVHFEKFVDYYEDAEIAFSELPDLADEVAKLRPRVDSVEMRVFLDNLDRLIAHAVSEKKKLFVIAD